MSRTLKIIVLVSLLVIAILAFTYANVMIAPGRLIKEHQSLNGDCFACHTSFRGIDSKKCIACHQTSEIGRLTSKGLPLAKPLTSATFHKELSRESCVSCHSDHEGVTRYQPTRKFDHSLLKAETSGKCQTCHKPPSDFVHQKIKGECAQCHAQTQWTPATFDHDKYFMLDSDHSAACSSCHLANDYQRYTCYGCHEHSLEKIRREHRKEGINQFDRCVECHRSGEADERD
jgi:hypothetical protein